MDRDPTAGRSPLQMARASASSVLTRARGPRWTGEAPVFENCGVVRAFVPMATVDPRLRLPCRPLASDSASEPAMTYGVALASVALTKRGRPACTSKLARRPSLAD